MRTTCTHARCTPTHHGLSLPKEHDCPALQLTTTYGPRGNGDLLQYSGFIVPDNPVTALEVQAELPLDDPLRAIRYVPAAVSARAPAPNAWDRLNLFACCNGPGFSFCATLA